MARTSGNIVIRSKRSVIACAGYGGAATGTVATEVRPLTSTTTDFVRLMPHSASSALEPRHRRELP